MIFHCGLWILKSELSSHRKTSSHKLSSHRELKCMLLLKKSQTESLHAAKFQFMTSGIGKIIETGKIGR